VLIKIISRECDIVWSGKRSKTFQSNLRLPFSESKYEPREKETVENHDWKTLLLIRLSRNTEVTNSSKGMWLLLGPYWRSGEIGQGCR
jgi:hypothetical protein